MSPPPLEERARRWLVAVLPPDYPADFSPAREAKLHEHLGLGDAALHDLRHALDAEFFCRLPPGEFEAARTWGDMLDLLARCSAAGAED
mgnify:FL=1